MKTLFTTLLLSLLGFGGIINAQNSGQTVRGTVTDEQSGAPLIGVTVVLIGSDPIQGTVTDLDGRFALESVPTGRQSFQFTFVGYDSRTTDGIAVQPGKQTVIDIQLLERVTSLDQVVIKVTDDNPGSAVNSMATVSARQISVDQARRYSGTRSDPSRMAQNYAGVGSAGDDRNDIVIRGNSPSGVLWRMEGIDIPNPSHFGTLGATGGPVTILNTNNLQDADFFTGAFPAEYGNATAGVFDLRLRNGNAYKHEFLGQIGFNGFELGAEGPLGGNNKASYVANYRYSTLGVLSALGFDFGTGAAIPQYQDLTFKLNIPTAKAGKFTVFGFGGLSYIEFLSSEKDIDREAVFGDDGLDQVFRSNTGAVGATHTYFFNPNTYGRAYVAVSGFQSTGEIDSISTEDLESLTRIGEIDNSQIRYTAGYVLNRKFNARNKINTGINADLSVLNLSEFNLVGGEDFRETTGFTGNAPTIRSWFQWQHRFNDKLTLTSGLNGLLFTLNNSWLAEPRLGLAYKLDKSSSLNFGAGLHGQTQALESYFVQTPDPVNSELIQTNRELDPVQSLHLVAGYDRLIGNRVRVKAEAYLQEIRDAAVESRSSSFSMLNAGADFGFPDNDSLINAGRGRNYGVELTVERFLNRGWYMLSTVSLFDSRYTGSDEVWRNTAFNTQYIGNLLAGKEWRFGSGGSDQGKNIIGFDTKVTVAGGRPYTQVDLESSRELGYQVDFDDRAFEERFPVYYRIDFKIGYTREGKRATQKFSVDLQNLTGAENIFSRTYNAFTGELDTRYQLGFFPDVQYRVIF